MTTVVLVPFRGGEPHRDRSWAFVHRRWLELGYRVYTDPGPAGPFNKSAAVNACAAKAGRGPRDWDVAIITDADVIIPRKEADTSSAVARVSKHAIRPFNNFHRVDAQGSEDAIAGRTIRPEHVLFSRKAPPGGILVVPRNLWEAVGGMDERFRGWGGEDNAFAYSLAVMGGAIRAIKGQAWHLWHPYAPHRHPDYRTNALLATAYRRARTKPEMRALIASRAPGASGLKDRHKGETATIIGKGPSILDLRASHIGPGPVIALNSALVQVRRLGLPNPIYTMQKDAGTVEPQEPETLILSSAQSPDAFPDYPHRYVVNIEAEFDLPWGSMSAPMAVELARHMGCRRLVMIGHDGYTRGIADKVENDRIVRVRPGGYRQAGIAANERARRHRLAIEWVATLGVERVA